MYGQLTTGKPVTIISRTSPQTAPHLFEVTVDTRKNQPLVLKEEKTEWDKQHGTRVEIELEASYKKGRRSVDDYVEQTALSNPHCRVLYSPPGSETITYERAIHELPEEAKEIKPHPYGVEVGHLMRMFQDTTERHIATALKNDFSRLTPKVVAEILKIADVSPKARPRDLDTPAIERIHKAFTKVRIMAPPTACLSPVGPGGPAEGAPVAIQGGVLRRGDPSARGVSRQSLSGRSGTRPRRRSARRRTDRAVPFREPRALAVPGLGVRDHQGGR